MAELVFAPIVAECLLSFKNTVSDSIVFAALPTNILPSVRFGTSFVRPTAKTSMSPLFALERETIAIFCIKLGTTGFVFVNPPPTATYKESPTL